MRGGIHDCDIELIDRNDTAHRARVLLRLDSLMRSIRSEGLQKPIVLRDVGGGGLQIVCGFRRVEAAYRLGIRHVRARVMNEVHDEAAFDHAWRENVGLKSLTDVDRGRGIRIYRDRYGRTISQLELKLGLSKRQIHRLCNLAEAPYQVQAALAEGWLSGTTAGVLLSSLRRTDRMDELELWLTRLRRDRLSGTALERAIVGEPIRRLYDGDLISVDLDTATREHQVEFNRRRLDLGDTNLQDLNTMARELNHLQQLIQARREKLLTRN